MPTGKITIRDIVIISVPKSHELSTGEADLINNSTSATVGDEGDVIIRLTNCINALIDLAASDHHSKNTSKDPDYLTRLSTHEFFFYTQRPLSITDFTKLLNNVALKLKSISPGIQLILGSFAIKNAHNEIMNVTPVIFSGKPTSFHFLVKNYISPIDVTYKDDRGESFKFADIDSKNPLPSISVDSQIRTFQFENFIQCCTSGATKFLTIVDICLDHFYGAAKQYLTIESQITPLLTEQPITQVIISNVVEIQPEYCLLGPVLHVDPLYSETGCKYGVRQVAVTMDLSHSFGKNKLSQFFLDPAVCLAGDDFHISPQIESICNQLKTKGSNNNNNKEAKLALMRITAFIEQYGDINAVINAGMTPLHYAAKSGLISAFDILLQNGAAIHVKTYQNYTPLHLATKGGHLHVVLRLLEKDYEQLEETTNLGATPLHLAVDNEHLEVMQTLIAHRANIDAKMPNGLTAIEIAVKRNNKAFVGILASAGATIDLEILLSSQSMSMRQKLVNEVFKQKYPATDIQNQIVEYILRGMIDPDNFMKPIKNPILRAKIYWAEKHIDPSTIRMERATLQTAMFVKIYQGIHGYNEPFKQEFAEMLMDLLGSSRPEDIQLAKQVIIRIYEIFPDETRLERILDHFIKIDQYLDIALSKTPKKYKSTKEADIQKQLHILKVAYLKSPDDEGKLLHAFKKLCKIVTYRRSAIDFFGRTTSMKNLAKFLTSEESSGLRAALHITSTDQQTLLSLINTYAQQKDIETYDPRPKPAFIDRHY